MPTSPPTPPSTDPPPTDPDTLLEAVAEANQVAIAVYHGQQARRDLLYGTVASEEVAAAAEVDRILLLLKSARAAQAQVRESRAAARSEVNARVAGEVEAAQQARLTAILQALAGGVSRREMSRRAGTSGSWCTRILATGYERWPWLFDPYPDLVPIGGARPGDFRDPESPEQTPRRGNVAAVAPPVEPTPDAPPEPDTDLLAEEF